jgi:hypothetical protein
LRYSFRALARQDLVAEMLVASQMVVEIGEACVDLMTGAAGKLGSGVVAELVNMVHEATHFFKFSLALVAAVTQPGGPLRVRVPIGTRCRKLLVKIAIVLLARYYMGLADWAPHVRVGLLKPRHCTMLVEDMIARKDATLTASSLVYRILADSAHLRSIDVAAHLCLDHVNLLGE